jgi:hypothetical protein
MAHRKTQSRGLTSVTLDPYLAADGSVCKRVQSEAVQPFFWNGRTAVFNLESISNEDIKTISTNAGR